MNPQTCKPFGEFNPNDQELYKQITQTLNAHCRSSPIGASNLSNALKLASLCFEMDGSTGDAVTDRVIVFSDLDQNLGEEEQIQQVSSHPEYPTENVLQEAADDVQHDLQTELLTTTEDGVSWHDRVKRGAIGGIHGDSNSKLWYTTVRIAGASVMYYWLGLEALVHNGPILSLIVR